jgi:histone-lysine N-methyltransferase SETMAR
MDENSLRSAPHPPYSPDLAPSDSFLFGHVAGMLQGAEFQTAEELLEVVVQILSDSPLKTLMTTFYQWMEKFQVSIDGHGEYVESKSILLQKLLLKSNRN